MGPHGMHSSQAGSRIVPVRFYVSVGRVDSPVKVKSVQQTLRVFSEECANDRSAGRDPDLDCGWHDLYGTRLTLAGCAVSDSARFPGITSCLPQTVRRQVRPDFTWAN